MERAGRFRDPRLRAGDPGDGIQGRCGGSLGLPARLRDPERDADPVSPATERARGSAGRLGSGRRQQAIEGHGRRAASRAKDDALAAAILRVAAGATTARRDSLTGSFLHSRDGTLCPTICISPNGSL